MSEPIEIVKSFNQPMPADIRHQLQAMFFGAFGEQAERLKAVGSDFCAYGSGNRSCIIGDMDATWRFRHPRVEIRQGDWMNVPLMSVATAKGTRLVGERELEVMTRWCLLKSDNSAMDRYWSELKRLKSLVQP